MEAPPPPKLKKSFLGNFPSSPTMERVESKMNEMRQTRKKMRKNLDDLEIDEPDLAEEEDKVYSANNEVIFFLFFPGIILIGCLHGDKSLTGMPKGRI
ncbi:hypothetical protein VP01_1543g1 [Puccinia sorghi]|uniref:Uncharacterized protein n=1 Tax=Puccinia sorghi TaxID=27349 RepID=A0A0L6VI98_9BASI|nr:hypothetical protein VP01_1543g1 [Puccinia sorghi]